MRVALTVICVITAPTFALCQPPPRDNPRPPLESGTAVMRGRVVAAENGRPLRRAQIRLTAPELGAGPGRVTSTDEEGRYEVDGLPAGHYIVRAARGGFLSLQFGQRRPSERGKTVEIANAQTVENVDFALPKMSVIAGRLADETGDPM